MEGRKQPDLSTLCTGSCFICRGGAQGDRKHQTVKGHCSCWDSKETRAVDVMGSDSWERGCGEPDSPYLDKKLFKWNSFFYLQSTWSTNGLLSTGKSQVVEGKLSFRNTRWPHRSFLYEGDFVGSKVRMLSWCLDSFMREDCGRVGHGICLRKWVELAEMGQRREGKTSSLQFLLLLPSYLWDSHPHKTMPGIFMRKKKKSWCISSCLEESDFNSFK